ncbi:MAG: DEAD/DEAH box helicase [Planctomycetes bacterium]|nr:DEAD/DEAH box helicase [Planctomycetota bacterium]
MPLVFLPDIEALFHWGPEATRRASPAASPIFEGSRATLLTPAGPREVTGRKLPLLETVSSLAVAPASELERLPGSIAIWALASKLALELVARERVVPTIHRGEKTEARWAVALASEEDFTRLAALARAMPPAAHAVAIPTDRAHSVWAPDAILRAFLDAVADAIVRRSNQLPQLESSSRPSRAPVAWSARWCAALLGPQRNFEADGFSERTVPDDIERWAEPALGMHDRLRACFRLELPATEREPFILRFLLQSPDDPSLLVPAAHVWQARGRSLQTLGRAFRNPQESLLEALGRASQIFPQLAPALEQPRPESMELDAAAAWSFLGGGAALLAEAGFGILVPGELTATGQRRLRLRMRVGTSDGRAAGHVAGVSELARAAILQVDWEAALGDEPISTKELAALAKQKAPLVRFRGAWIAIDPNELGEIQARLKTGPSTLKKQDAIRAVLAGESRVGPMSVAVTATGELAQQLESMRSSSAEPLDPPRSLQATLRPYQSRGLHWLTTMSALGLGACLADDMGLGKTIQLLAFLLHRLNDPHCELRPTLLIAPTSVVGNWEREVARFAPLLEVVPYYGASRARMLARASTNPRALIITTYGVLRRDAEYLSGIEWSVVALDEAQNIKNAASATAQAARGLQARHRIALTGTPVENRLAELWSILEFVNPGLLGSLESFRREFAVPVERYGDDAAATRLRRIVGPFILRRLKSDPNILQDLPPKNEMKVVCTLTREQATLYKAVVDEELERIESSKGIERRGRVLALLLFTKQICNHPAQYLGDRGPLPNRSGKLARATEMLEEAIAAGDKALVFTQFREMGDHLVEHLTQRLRGEILFLHGGTPKKARDEMVQRFQEESQGPRIFVLSVKAGGTGLNLTAANHVFRFDRWWNPAVEDQATDRAHRIGQMRAVQVHKLVCAGTVEERIDALLERKRDLATRIVGSGEHWITELDGRELHDLFALSKAAIADADEGEADSVLVAEPWSSQPGKRSRRGVTR